MAERDYHDKCCDCFKAQKCEFLPACLSVGDAMNSFIVISSLPSQLRPTKIYMPVS